MTKQVNEAGLICLDQEKIKRLAKEAYRHGTPYRGIVNILVDKTFKSIEFFDEDGGYSEECSMSEMARRLDSKDIKDTYVKAEHYAKLVYGLELLVAFYNNSYSISDEFHNLAKGRLLSLIDAYPQQLSPVTWQGSRVTESHSDEPNVELGS